MRFSALDEIAGIGFRVLGVLAPRLVSKVSILGYSGLLAFIRLCNKV